MTWCNESTDHDNRMIINQADHDLIAKTNKFRTSTSANTNSSIIAEEFRTITCPSCGHHMEFHDQQAGIHDLPGLPAGVKFDPTDQEILEHLEAKVISDIRKLHPLIDEFIPTLDGENGICYTHPERLPGVNKDGQIRHFFHRPSKAYTTGTRKRRKVHTDEDGSETRWHKTGKTRPVLVGREVKGFKKILVLYTNYGRQRKPEKTNWVMHQYHMGNNEEEKDGELVVSKVFYQTQPRQCGSGLKEIGFDQPISGVLVDDNTSSKKPNLRDQVDYYSNNPSSFLNYDDQHQGSQTNREAPPQLIIPNLVVQSDHGSSFVHRLTSDASK